MQRQVRTWAAVATAAALFSASASAQFTETFESYPASAGGTTFTTGPANSGGWKQWFLAANSHTKCFGTGATPAAHGGSQYIGTQLNSDCVREFTTFTSGYWDVRVWTYVPGSLSSQPMQDLQYFILMNVYADNGVGLQWATQMTFDPSLGEVRADNGNSLVTNSPQWGVGTTLQFDAWKEVLVEVDVSNDTAQVYYDGSALGDPFRWSLGPFGNNPVTTVPAIDCVDLYANDTTLTPSFMFWDDFSITAHQTTPAPSNYCTVGTTSNGCSPTITTASGAPSAAATSGFVLNSNNVDGNRSGLFFYAISDPTFVPAQWGLGGTSYLCIKAPTQRMTFQASGGTNGACDGSFTEDWLAFMAGNPAALGSPLTAGATFEAQLWMRDPPAPKTTTLSNALRFTLAP